MKTIMISLLFCSIVVAAPVRISEGFEIKTELSINGKLVASPTILTKEGVHTSVNTDLQSEKLFVDVIAMEMDTRDRAEGIRMKFVVSLMGSDGRRRIIGTPEIVALENEATQIHVGEIYGDSMSIIAIPIRRHLTETFYKF